MNNVFWNIAAFNNCYFNRNVNFSSCNFKQTANFENNEVRGFFKANYSVFADKTLFYNSKFFGLVQFYKINSKKNFVFSKNTSFDKTDFNQAFFDGTLQIKENSFGQKIQINEEILKSDTCIVEIQESLQ
jgi:hypothetical protein